MEIGPVTLEGAHVRLEPFDFGRHWEGLRHAWRERPLWRWTVSRANDEADLRAYFEQALADQARGASVVFATIHRASGRAAGSTRFGNIARESKRAEIGWTWLLPEFQRTALNTEAKYLMLRHAFEWWGLMRVELKTSLMNEKSREAMRRLGLVEEGVFRKWNFHADGTPRDTIWFSVIDDEWPATKAHIETLMAARR